MSNTSIFKHPSLAFGILFTLFAGAMNQGGELLWLAVANFSALCLLFIYLKSNYRNNIILPNSVLSKAIVAFVLWCFITVLWSPAPQISLLIAFNMLAIVIGLYAYYFLTHKAISWVNLWQVIIVFAVFLSVYSMIEVLIGVEEPSSLFLNKNTHASYLNLIILPTVAYFLISTKKHTSIIFAVSLFLLTFSAALPGSRGATIGQFIGILLIVAIAWKHIPLKKIKTFSALYVGALVLATAATSNLLRFAKYSAENADLGRYEIWLGAINLLKNTPWYGNGLGTYWLLHPAYRHIDDPSSGHNAHNDLLQFLIEMGVPSILLLLVIIFAVFFLLYRILQSKSITSHAKIEAAGLVAAFLAIGFHSLFSFVLGMYSILFLLGIILARLIHLSHKTQLFTLANNLPLQKSHQPIFVLFSLVLVIHTVSIITGSYYFSKAHQFFKENNLLSASQSNALAYAFYPFDNRFYFLDARIYSTILKQRDTQSEIQEQLIQKTLFSFNKAKQLNPFNPLNYYFHARFLQEQNTKPTKAQQSEIKRLYTKALAVNPRHIPSSIELIKIYQSNNNLDKASLVAYKAIQYWHSRHNRFLPYLYQLSEEVFKQTGNLENQNLLTTKRALLKKLLNENVKP